MKSSSEVLVLGGGMAGAAAALAASTRGRSVTLFRRAPGATALSSGAIDIVPSPKATETKMSISAKSTTSIRDWIEEVVAGSPFHPFVSIGDAGLDLLNDAADMMLGRLGDAGLEHAPLDANGPGHLVVGSTGMVRRVASAQTSQILGDIDPRKTRVGVVNFRSHSLLDTGLVLSGLKRTVGKVVSVDIDWPDEPDGAFLLPTEIGRRLDDPKYRSGLFGLLRAAVAGRELTHLVLPPIAGLERPNDVIGGLSDVTGARVLETLGGEASLPGMRLDRALIRALEAGGVRVETTTSSDSEAGLSRHTGAIVLASGRFIGGGLRRAGRIFETIFDLPVFDGNRRLLEEPVELLTRRRVLERHDLFRAGVRVDENIRPLDLGGKPFRDGLFAAGAVIGGHDPHLDRSGLGLALLTGYLAGRRAAEWKPS